MTPKILTEEEPKLEWSKQPISMTGMALLVITTGKKIIVSLQMPEPIIDSILASRQEVVTLKAANLEFGMRAESAERETSLVRAALSRLKEAMSEEVCEWKPVDEFDNEGNYSTSCGQEFALTSGTLSENDFKFCCHCGKPLRSRLQSEGEKNAIR